MIHISNNIEHRYFYLIKKSRMKKGNNLNINEPQYNSNILVRPSATS